MNKKLVVAKSVTSRTPLTLNQLLAQNVLLERKLWLQRLLDPKRDIDTECGHPYEISVEDYKRLWLRGDIATRVVSLFPEESWSDNPKVFETEDEDETEFEQTWMDLEDRLRIYSMLQRIDILSGIGRFGVLLLGIDDGLALDQPAVGVDEKGEAVGNPGHQLLFLRAFDESLVAV